MLEKISSVMRWIAELERAEGRFLGVAGVAKLRFGFWEVSV